MGPVHTIRSTIIAVSAVATSVVVGLLVPGAALAGRSSTASSCASQALTLGQTVQRFAADIKSAPGKPTATGAALLAAASTQSYAAVAGLLGFAGPSTDAAPASSAVNTTAGFSLTDGQPRSGQTTETALRSLSSVRRKAGANIWVTPCNYGQKATGIWYCAPGSQCSSSGIFSNGTSQDVDNGGCSIVNLYSCQKGTVATPNAFNRVEEIDIFQTVTGSPVWGDRWCG